MLRNQRHVTVPAAVTFTCFSVSNIFFYFHIFQEELCFFFIFLCFVCLDGGEMISQHDVSITAAASSQVRVSNKHTCVH